MRNFRPASFSSPFEIAKKLSLTDCVVCTADRKPQFRVSHINMLKHYYSRFNPQIDQMTGPAISLGAMFATVPDSAKAP